MTMNPDDKFVTPRPPPQPPLVPRLSSSPSESVRKSFSRSRSPKAEKPSWSPKMLFGRKFSVTKKAEATLSVSAPQTRNPSPQSFEQTLSRDPSPLPRSLAQETSKNPHIASLLVSECIAEDLEDDDNFAQQPNNRMSLVSTPLSPPPVSHVRPLTTSHASSRSSASSNDAYKPLPRVPDESLEVLTPQPIRTWENIPLIHSGPQCSRFSVSTISSVMSIDSFSAFSTSPSVSDEDELAVDLDATSDVDDDVDDEEDDDEFVFRPLSSDASGRLFTGYSLPDVESSSKQALRKAPLSGAGNRATFGGMDRPTVEDEEGGSSPLHELLSELGYLEDTIVGK